MSEARTVRSFVRSSNSSGSLQLDCAAPRNEVCELLCEMVLLRPLDDRAELRGSTADVDAPSGFAILTVHDRLDLTGCREVLRLMQEAQ